MAGQTRPLHVSLIAIPDAALSTLAGIYDVLGSFAMLSRTEPSIPSEPPFAVEIVGAQRGSVPLVSGVPVGLGSYVQWDRKLDGRLAQALLSIQAI